MDGPPPLEDVPSLLSKISLKEKQNEDASQEKNLKIKDNPTSFAGMKKGFLFNDTKEKKIQTHQVAKEERDIPYIKKSSDKSDLVIKEVQEAMAANPFTEFQDTISSKIESNSDVSHVLTDPTWLEILHEFQTDPEKAMIKYKDNSNVRKTMTKLCSVFGESFLHMESSNKSEEEVLSRQMMESPELKDALTDPYIERIMGHMKKGENDQVHRLLQNSSQTEREKIKLLVDFGLFSFVS